MKYIYVGYMQTQHGKRLCGNTYPTHAAAIQNMEAIHAADVADTFQLGDTTGIWKPLGVWKVKKVTYDDANSTLQDFDEFIPYQKD